MIEGTAVYAYCILDNNNTYDTTTALTFFIDNVQVGSFFHAPDGSASYQYNTLVYANASLPNGFHTFQIFLPFAPHYLILFDYVQYTR